jgi:hypothetical protein
MTQKLVAVIYADHARDADTAWVILARLCQRATLGKTAARDALRGLVGAGWLVETVPATSRTTATYRLTFPGEGSVSRTPGVHDTDPTGPAGGPRAFGSRTPGVRETDPTSGLTSDLTSSLSAHEEADRVDTTTTRETTSQGDSFGTRAVAALGRDDLSPAQLDQAYKHVRDRIGDKDAADAVTELAMQRGIENYPRYVKGIPDDDDLRALADDQRRNRARAATNSARVPVEATPNRCEHGHPNGLRRAADGSSPCPLCDRAAAPDGASGRIRGLAAA